MSDIWVLVLAGVPIVVATVLALIEVVARPDLATGRRVLWVIVLVGVPVIGVAVYAVVRPLRRGNPTLDDADGSSAAERLVVAAERRQRGEIDDEEFRGVAAEFRA